MNWNVASHLDRLAREQPFSPALHIPRRGGHDTITYQHLNADADKLAAGLHSIGITRGVRTALMVPPSLDFFSLTFALFKVAAVPVFIDPGMGIKNLGKCLADASPEAFIGIPKAHLARRILGWAKKSVRMTVNVGSRRFLCSASTGEMRGMVQSARDGKSAQLTLPPRPEESKEPGDAPRSAHPEVSPSDLAAILFTSGSTGLAKGAEYTHGIFMAQVQILKDTYGIQPGEVDFCTFPLFALFGPALGMSCVIPEMDFSRPASIDPHKALEHLRQFHVTNMFGSPAVIRKIAGIAERSQPKLDKLRRVISAGAPASPTVLARFTQLLPESVQVFTPYGATESLPVANIGSHEILNETRPLTDAGHGVCLGQPVRGIHVKVIQITDSAIPEWQDSLALPPGHIGEFVVRGPVVTQRYFNKPEATAQAKIRDSQTGEVLHRMGDVGYLDERGRLWFCGRKSHRVETPEGTMFTDMVEPIFNTVPGVLRTALVGVRREGRVFPVLCVELDGSKVKAELAPLLKERAIQGEQRSVSLPVSSQLHGPRTQIAPVGQITTFLFHPKFPMDVRHNSKIFREKLAVWADRKLGARWKGGAT